MDSILQFLSDCGTVLSRYGISFLRGAGLTVVLAVACTAIGCVIGFGVGLIRSIPTQPGQPPLQRGLLQMARAVLAVYVEFFRGTPLMLQAMFIFYGSAYAFHLHMDTFPAGIFILSINTGAYMAESVRGGIQAVDPGQMEGAKAIGMTHMQAMFHVILPQTLRNLVPQIGNHFIINLKDSSMLSVISVTELFFSFKSAAAAVYLYFPAAFLAMLLYLIMTLVSARLLRVWERSLSGAENYELTGDPFSLDAGGAGPNDKEATV
ncbi:amino acid ABC transporter permease [Flavonifractor sp. DFI.6.63]|uniref:Amino acid ABC transporter permease n=2 Tax=Lawsonibacter TaxID=2172004 RepID=A0A8J6MF12_9FIRM|nr:MULTISPECIES: amino acid ABC transporter permease [Oscillospiraceae]MBC5733848.1 amino acid ABC transporter permease [Lawsonibacter hominis]MCQ5031255.1 amino acid ABC transporter permease [Flavonifractor sp. DFI.6.63]